MTSTEFPLASSVIELSPSYLERFAGIGRLYGQAALVQLAQAHFVVVGVGGVGSWVAESLARSGVGELTLVDLDEVCVTNSNRQLHALTSTVGQPKVAVLAARLQQINPELVVHSREEFVALDTVAECIPENADVVIDAIDAANIKAAMIARCKRRKQLILTVGSAGGKRDPRQITTRDLSKTTTDPLLAKTRNFLRRLHGFSRNPKSNFSVEATYSTEQMAYPTAEGEVCASKDGLAGGVKLDCSGGFGAATMVTGTFGFVVAARAIEKLLDKRARQTQSA